MEKISKGDDEDSREHGEVPASRGGCKPGTSSVLLKITSEPQCLKFIIKVPDCKKRCQTARRFVSI